MACIEHLPSIQLRASYEVQYIGPQLRQAGNLLMCAEVPRFENHDYLIGAADNFGLHGIIIDGELHIIA